MSIFSRYVFRQASGSLLLILLSLTGIVWISLALRELNVVTTSGQSAWTLLKLTTLGLPSFVATLAPFAMLIASIHTLNRLNGDSEIIVLTASGATAWTVVRPIVFLALITMILIGFVNHLAAPWCFRQLAVTMTAVRTDLLTQLIQPGRFSGPEAGLMFHIRDRAPNGELSGLLMDDSRDPKKAQMYTAEKGLLLQQDGVAYLLMNNGHIFRTKGADAPVEIIAFDRYVINLDGFEPKTGAAPKRKPQEMYFDELLEAAAASRAANAQQDANAAAAESAPTGPQRRKQSRELAELHERFASMFYPLAFGMLAVAMVGQARSTRNNSNTSAGNCFAAGALTKLLGLAANNVVVLNPGAVAVLYVIPLSLMAFSALAIARGGSGSNALQDLNDRFAAAGKRLLSAIGLTRSDLNSGA